MRYLPFCRAALLMLVLTLVATSASWASDELLYGSKVNWNDVDLGLALSPLYYTEFAFWDKNDDRILGANEVVYLHINTGVNKVSLNDVRLTDYDIYPAGSQVGDDPDLGKTLRMFGTTPTPRAELRFYDVLGDWAYNLEDPIYLKIEPGNIKSSDIRITNYVGFPPGCRVSGIDPEIGSDTETLPGRLCFLNKNGNINNAGYAMYDEGDVIYIDFQEPSYVVTINDVRLSRSET